MPATARLHSAAPKIRREPDQLVIPVGTLLEDWREEVVALQANHKASLTWLGDAYAWGSDHYADDLVAETVSPYFAESVARAIRVCRAVPPQRRHGCGFSFLQSVEKLPPEEQDEILARAAKGDWPREAMREELRERKAKREAEERARQGSLDPEPEASNVHHLALPAPSPEEPANDEHYASDNLRVPEPEPDQSNQPAPTPTEAVTLIEQYAASPAVPPQIRAAFHALIDERDMLLKIANSARLSIEMAGGFTSPAMRQAVEQWRGRYPSTV